MEPIYEYIKGQGWLPQVSEVFTLHDGYKVMFIKRLPKAGERYGSFDYDTDFQQYIKSVRKMDYHYEYRHYPKADYDYKDRNDELIYTLQVVYDPNN